MTEDTKDIQDNNAEAGAVQDGKGTSTEQAAVAEQTETQTSDAAAEAEASKGETAKSSGDSGLAERLARLEAENAELKDKVLRAMAEVENVRRRTEREKADISKYAISKFAADVVGVSDNFRRAIEATPKEALSSQPALRSLAEGVEMIERDFLNVLERHGIKRIDPLHEKFDPNFHQAMFEEESLDVAPGAVVRVMQAGFMIDERLLRPALVSVAKAWTGPIPEPQPAAAPAETAPIAADPVDEQPAPSEFEAVASNASIREPRTQGFGPSRPEWTAPRAARPNPRSTVTELRSKPSEGQTRPRVAAVDPNPFMGSQRPPQPQVKPTNPGATMRPSTLHQPVITTPQKRNGS